MSLRRTLTSAAFSALFVAGCTEFANTAPRTEVVADVPTATDVVRSSDAGRSNPNLSASPPSLPRRVEPARSPPPISGGTLAVSPDDHFAVASDPDRDVVWVATTDDLSPGRRVALRPGDEPGRVAFDGDGLAHVALRGAGAVATVDPRSATVVRRVAVCAAPRGITSDGARSLLVACAGGELVTLSTDGRELARTSVTPDLRDVVIAGGVPYVTTLRGASVTRVRDGARELVVDAHAPTGTPDRVASAAWRTVAVGTRLVTLAQSTTLAPFNTGFSGLYYASQTDPPVVPVVVQRWVDGPTRGPPRTSVLASAGLAVDVAPDPSASGLRVAVACPGWAFRQGPSQVLIYDVETSLSRPPPQSTRALRGQVVAVAYTSSGMLLAQTRAPSRLEWLDGTTDGVALGDADEAIAQEGHDLFHASTAFGVACASCHPEGGDDGRTWLFLDVRSRSGAEPRRTQSLRGGIADTAPFHWAGDIADMAHLAREVFTTRMAGGALDDSQTVSLARWIQSLRRVPRSEPADAEAVARGERLFRSSDVACASCHSGPLYTNNQTVDVGSGGVFQVPALVDLASRAPYMHDGCALTLAQRLTDSRCGGTAHGGTSQLTPAQRADLVAFLQTL